MISNLRSRSQTFLRSLAVALFAAAAAVPVHPQENRTSTFPKREVRAVWIATINGLDWPKSAVAAEQQESLRRMVVELRRAHFNTIFFQVRGRGDAMYRSRFEPWAQSLTGTFGKDPGWDPLQFLLDTAHAYGIEVHAWVNTYLIKSSRLETPETTPRHIVLDHPEWLRNVEGEYWIDPGIPPARKYLADVVLDLVTRYDVDGIQFDFIRYPARPFQDDATFKKYGGKSSRADWRRENVTAFVRDVYGKIHTARPEVKVGSAPIGIYQNFGSVRGLQSYSDLSQDSRLWLKEGIQDYLVPQVYWSLGAQPGDPDFAEVAREWSAQRFGRHLYLGVGAYKPDVHGQLPELIDISRSLNVRGNAFFRYENISDVMAMGGRYASPANIPPMPWIDSIPPLPPQNLQVTFDAGKEAGGVFTLHWTFPQNGPREAAYCNIYRSTSQPLDTGDPLNILAIVPSTAGMYADTIRHPVSGKYYYAVSGFDRGNNESAATPAQSVTMPEVLALSREFSPVNALGDCFRQPSSTLVYFPYEVEKPSPVFVKILDGNNIEVATVVDAVQQAGSYIAAADISRLSRGNYTCMFIAGEYTEKKSFRVDR